MFSALPLGANMMTVKEEEEPALTKYYMNKWAEEVLY